VSCTVIGLQSETLVLASVLPAASFTGVRFDHYFGAPLSRGAWLCVFAGPSIYSASQAVKLLSWP